MDTSTDDLHSFEDLVHTESVIKERTLARIRNAARERSGSELDLNQNQEHSKIVLESKNVFFEGIPEPYPHSTNYQRVEITDTGEPTDVDTIEACKKLKSIMNIRNKWISAHPFPPQDVDSFEDSCGSPPRKSSADYGGDSFRRRSVPPYEIFDQSLPDSELTLKCKMIAGVMSVMKVVDGESPSEQDTSLFPVLSFKEFVDDFNYVSFVC
jgi:hypothetical protein